MKKLPKQFEILGRKFDIQYDKSLGENLGVCFPDNGLIKIVKNKFLPRDSVEHTLWHEISHAILYAMGEEELFRNEKFIDLLGGILYQISKTLK
jgi:hypothetical protein